MVLFSSYRRYPKLQVYLIYRVIQKDTQKGKISLQGTHHDSGNAWKKIFSMGTIFELVAILIPSPQGRKNLNSSLRIFCPTISSWDMGLNLHFNQILSNWGGVRTLSPHESQENFWYLILGAEGTRSGVQCFTEAELSGRVSKELTIHTRTNLLSQTQQYIILVSERWNHRKQNSFWVGITTSLQTSQTDNHHSQYQFKKPCETYNSWFACGS